MYPAVSARMDTLGSRIKLSRQRAELSQVELARRIGVRSQTINQWESGAKAPSRQNFARLVQITGVSATWLLYGGSSSEHSSNPYEESPTGRGRRVPRWSLMEIVSRASLSNATASVFANFPCSAEAYAFDLPNDSCAPDYQRGALWIVDPAVTPTPGRLVLATYGEARVPIYGEYREEVSASGRVVIVAPLNEKWPVARSDIGPLEVLGTMTESIHPAR